MITAAQRLHELETIGTGVSHAFHNRVRSEGGEPQGKTESKESTSEGRTETRSYYRCNKKSHITKDCSEVQGEKR
jgi:hypothetical protein